jgi:hypothetical protein
MNLWQNSESDKVGMSEFERAIEAPNNTAKSNCTKAGNIECLRAKRMISFIPLAHDKSKKGAGAT